MPASTEMIRNIVFDIGRVLVDLTPGPLVELLSAHGGGQLSLEQIVTRIRLRDHETGRLAGRGLLENLARLVPQPLPLDELHARWLDMFELQVQMVDLAHRLAAHHRVFLLSNIGDLHWAHLSREFGLHRIGEGALPSFVAGVMKPDAEIYAEAERRFGLAPGETLFIDDRRENIEAAARRGWHGIVHGDYPTTRAALAERLAAPAHFISRP